MESDRPIPAPAKSLGNIAKRGVMGVQSEIMAAPAIHRQFAGGATQQVDQIMASEASSRSLAIKPPKPRGGLGRGDDVIDLEHRRKGTIIRVLQCSNGLPKYEVVDSEGNSWKQKGAYLRLR